MITSRRTLLASVAAASALAAQDQTSATGRKLRLAFIGTGHRAWAHLQILKTVPDFEVVALADPSPELLDRAASIAGSRAKTYSTYQEMLAKEKDLDAVIVVTPTFLHSDATIASLASGHHVLCEKPMALNIEQANAMNAAAERAHKILQIGMQMRYDPMYEKMAALVTGGAIGPLRYVSGTLFRGDWNPQSWKYIDPKTGIATNWRFLKGTAGSSLMEDGIHELDVLNWMIGSRVTRIYATGGNSVLKNRETLDHAGLLIDYESGIKVAFEFCLFAQGAGSATRRMTLIGEGGNLQSEIGKLELRRQGAAAQAVQIPTKIPKQAGAVPTSGPAQDIGTYLQYLAFANSIRTGARPFCNGDTAKEALKISLLAEKSIRERAIVSWTDLPA